ncbi:hypothetical protein ACX1EJ_00205 [Legionella pneumophila]
MDFIESGGYREKAGERGFALTFFICGKQFWDKFKSLFIYDSYVVFEKNKK